MNLYIGRNELNWIKKKIENICGGWDLGYEISIWNWKVLTLKALRREETFLYMVNESNEREESKQSLIRFRADKK